MKGIKRLQNRPAVEKMGKGRKEKNSKLAGFQLEMSHCCEFKSHRSSRGRHGRKKAGGKGQTPARRRQKEAAVGRAPGPRPSNF